MGFYFPFMASVRETPFAEFHHIADVHDRPHSKGTSGTDLCAFFSFRQMKEKQQHRHSKTLISNCTTSCIFSGLFKAQVPK